MEENNQGPIQEFGTQTQNTVESTQTVQQQQVQNTQYQTTQNEQTKKINTLCMASFICSLVGLLVAGLPLGIAAIITGGIGLSKYNVQSEKGKWMAIAGIVVGAIDIVAVIFYLSTLSTVGSNYNKLYNLYK